MYHVISRVMNRRRLSSQLFQEQQNAAKCTAQSPDHEEDNLELRQMDTNLTILERRALLITWRRIAGSNSTNGVKICQRIFDRLTTDEPSIKKIFYSFTFVQAMSTSTTSTTTSSPSPSVHCHGKLLAQFIDSLIVYLCERTRAVPVTGKHIGRNHVCFHNYGMNAQMFETFGIILSDTLLEQPCIQALPRAAKAWNILCAILTDHFRAGESLLAKYICHGTHRIRGGTQTTSVQPSPSCSAHANPVT